ncbi:uncharacterized protein LOC135390085 isoform X2 [Ornithodoros turicata]
MHTITGAILVALVCTTLAVDEPSPPGSTENRAVTVGSSMAVSPPESSNKPQTAQASPAITIPPQLQQRRYPGPVVQYNPPPAAVARLTVVAQTSPGELPSGVQASPAYLYGTQPGRAVGPSPNSYFTLGLPQGAPQHLVAQPGVQVQHVASQPAVPSQQQVVVGSAVGVPQVYSVPNTAAAPVRGAGVNPTGSFLVGSQVQGPAGAAVAPQVGSPVTLRSPQVVYGRPVAGVQVAPPATYPGVQPVQTVQYAQPAPAAVYQPVAAYQPAPVPYYGQQVAYSAPVQVG